jgi:hypothetical protein
VGGYINWVINCNSFVLSITIDRIALKKKSALRQYPLIVGEMDSENFSPYRSDGKLVRFDFYVPRHLQYLL